MSFEFRVLIMNDRRTHWRESTWSGYAKRVKGPCATAVSVGRATSLRPHMNLPPAPRTVFYLCIYSTWKATVENSAYAALISKN